MAFSKTFSTQPTQMVNNGFPEEGRYGFELVDSPIRWTAASMENLRRIKSVEICSSFLRFNFNANTRGLSRTVSGGVAV